ncbi:hypothetical protein Q3G72_008921 [Acer saccharum]|nr:hypothetical protein Q3G72_008921 [Acer saccharum]
MVDGGRGETEDGEFISSENLEIREELIQATVEEEKRREAEFRVVDSDEDVVLATLVVDNKSAHSKGRVNGFSQGIRQSSRMKAKGSSSHSMRTRNARLRGAEEVLGNQAMEVGSVEAEVANTIAIGSAIGIDFSKVEEEVLEEMPIREEEDLACYATISGCRSHGGVDGSPQACFLCLEIEALSGRKFCFQSDSKEAIGWVKDAVFGNLLLVEVIYDVRSKLRVVSVVCGVFVVFSLLCFLAVLFAFLFGKQNYSEKRRYNILLVMAASAKVLTPEMRTVNEDWTIVLPRRGRKGRNLPRIRTPEEQQKPWFPTELMVIYGIGSIESYETPRLRLSLAISMKRKLGWIGDVEGRRCAIKPTIFYMPHCEAELYDNLLQANQGVMLKGMVLLGNSFETYEQHVSEYKSSVIVDTERHVLAVQH